jgi:hypothetical protein
MPRSRAANWVTKPLDEKNSFEYGWCLESTGTTADHIPVPKDEEAENGGVEYIEHAAKSSLVESKQGLDKKGG